MKKYPVTVDMRHLTEVEWTATGWEVQSVEFVLSKEGSSVRTEYLVPEDEMETLFLGMDSMIKELRS